MTTIEEVTNFVIGYMESSDYNFRDPESARGMCYEVSIELMYEFRFSKSIYSFHNNNRLVRFNELGQHSDHHAIMHRGKVLDYTLRQFDESTPWPFYGTVSEWKSILEKAWDTKVNHYILDSPDEGFLVLEDEEG